MREIFEKYLSVIEDTRCQCDIDHKLVDVLIIVMCAVISGIDELEEIITFGKEKQAFFKKYFSITKIPSETTLTRIMNMVNGEAVAQSIVNIMKEQLGKTGDVIAIDGKTICRTAKKNSSREKLHIVTAYLTESGVTLGQLTVNEKMNEIPIVRELLDMIDVKGKVITADAMHCQKDTVAKIIGNGGNYILGLKGNQETMHDEVKLYLDDCISDKLITMETSKTIEKNKDRYEERICYKAPTIDWMTNKDEWAGLSCVFAIYRKTITDNEITEETSYYISSLETSAERLMNHTRDHWKIESMHWQLDVVFSEDNCRILSSNGQKSMNILRKLALALHKNLVSNLKKKTSLKNSMFKALLSEQYLLDVIQTIL